MGQYFKFVNPAKVQYLDEPMSDNKWHNILNERSGAVRVLNHLICKSGVEHGIRGTWSGDAVYIAGDEGDPDSFGIPTATRSHPHRNLYDKAEEEYENLIGRGDAMLDEQKFEDDKAFLIVNLTKCQFFDPLCFSEFSPGSDPLGDLQGLALASLYCRSERTEGFPYFGTWSKDEIELVREGTAPYEQALRNFENVGYTAIEVLHKYFHFREDFSSLAILNPRFLDQLRLSNISEQWRSEAENKSSEARKDAVLEQLLSVAKEWVRAQSAWKAYAQVISAPLADDIQALPGALEYIAAARASFAKQSEIVASQSAEEILRKAFVRAQLVHQNESPCGIEFDEVEAAFRGDKERFDRKPVPPHFKGKPTQPLQGEIPSHVTGDLNLRGRTDITDLPNGLSVTGDLILDSCSSITSLPEGLSVDGNLYLNKCTGLTALPEGISIRGDRISLDECSSLSYLPPGLAIQGTLSLRNCVALTRLPKGLSVGGDLVLTGCSALEELPDGLVVGQCLVMHGCKKITSLPEDVSIGLNLNANFSGITSLPDRLEVGGMVDLRNTPVENLPKFFSVGGTLSLDGCIAISKLPDELSVGGDLRLCGCVGITSLPEGISVKGTAYLLWCTGITYLPEKFSIHTLLLDGTRITSLPEDLHFSGTLSLGGCTDLYRLPENLSVGDSLRISDCTGLTRLPAKLSIGRALILSGCANIESIPYATIHGDLRISDCLGITALPECLSVGGDLDVQRCSNLRALPDGLVVQGNLDASGCSSIRALPEKFSIDGGLNLTDCVNLATLPNGLTVGGNLILKGCSALRHLPDDLSVNGYLDVRGCPGLREVPTSIKVRDNTMMD